MTTPEWKPATEADLLRDARMYAEHVVQCIDAGRHEHARIDADRAAECLRAVTERQQAGR